jgi:UDP-glucuronate decarboxylase
MTDQILKNDLAYIHDGLIGNYKNLSGATVVVTGCAGFLGFYILQYLVRYGEKLNINKVIGLDNFLLGRPLWLDQLASEFSTILDIEELDVSVGSFDGISSCGEANYVVHCASIASPTFYRRYPLETMYANVWGLRNLLEFYKESADLKGVLFFSSSEIYGDPPKEAIPTDEEYRGNVTCHGPRACYDESKRFSETLCWVFAEQFGMPITIARPFNNYGPGMKLGDRRLPADFAKCVLEGRDIEILSDGSPTRTFCYVADAVVGYFLCLFHGKYDYFNIGVDTPEISVLDVARIYQKVAQENFETNIEVRYSESDDKDYLIDNPNRRCPIITKAKSVLGYEPKITIEDGVTRYLRFLKSELAA